MRLPKTVELPNPDVIDYQNSSQVLDYLTRMNQSIRTAFRLVRSDFNNIRGNTVTVVQTLSLLERSTDPAAPAEGENVVWVSDGTEKGDDGDVMVAGTAGGVTKYGTLFDHSGGTPW